MRYPNPLSVYPIPFARITSITDQGFRGLFILLSIRPQLVLSRPSPYFAYARATFGSGCEECEEDELRLSEPGDDGAEDPGISADAAVGFAVALAAAAAAAGLQCAQTKTLKPRPLQLRQIAPLGIMLVLGCSCKGYLGAGIYLGAFPAQPLHVTTVRPPMHDTCSGSRLNKEWVELAILMEIEV